MARGHRDDLIKDLITSIAKRAKTGKYQKEWRGPKKKVGGYKASDKKTSTHGVMTMVDPHLQPNGAKLGFPTIARASSRPRRRSLFSRHVTSCPACGSEGGALCSEALLLLREANY